MQGAGDAGEPPALPATAFGSAQHRVRRLGSAGGSPASLAPRQNAGAVRGVPNAGAYCAPGTGAVDVRAGGTTSARRASARRRCCSPPACCCRASSATGARRCSAYRVGAGPRPTPTTPRSRFPTCSTICSPAARCRSRSCRCTPGTWRADDEAGAERLLATVLGTLTAVGGGRDGAAVVVRRAAGRAAVSALRRRDPGADCVHLTRIVLPAQVFFITGGIINATLFAHGRFGAAAVAPLLYNTGIIAGGCCSRRGWRSAVEGFAWGALVGAALGPFLAPLLEARGHIAPARCASRRSIATFLGYLAGRRAADVRPDTAHGRRVVPALVRRAARRRHGVAPRLRRRLMQVPVAVVGQAIAAAALPTLSRLFAEDRSDELNAHRAAHAAGRPRRSRSSPPPAASRWRSRWSRLVYQHGAFTAADTAAASAASCRSSASPCRRGSRSRSSLRAFYARGRHVAPDAPRHRRSRSAPIPLYLDARPNATGSAASPLARCHRHDDQRAG